MSGPVADGEPVLFVVTRFARFSDEKVVEVVTAFAIGDHAVTSKHAILPDSDEPQRDVRTLGWLRPEAEGIRWCRGHGEEKAAALLAAVALERSR